MLPTFRVQTTFATRLDLLTSDSISAGVMGVCMLRGSCAGMPMFSVPVLAKHEFLEAAGLGANLAAV